MSERWEARAMDGGKESEDFRRGYKRAIADLEKACLDTDWPFREGGLRVALTVLKKKLKEL